MNYGVLKFFNNTNADVYKITESNSYEHNFVKEFIKTVSCDIQAFGGELYGKEYGKEIFRKLKLYCECDECIKEGNYVLLDGVFYIISFVDNRDMGAKAILERRNLNV